MRNMPLVRYQDVVDQTVEVDRDGFSLLEVSNRGGLPHFHQCNATARCTTCRVRVLENAHNLSHRSGAEAQIATEKSWPADIRLACQTKVLGDVTIARMVLETEAAEVIFPTTPSTYQAEERPLAVMFCDLRNFTSFAAAHLSHDVVYVLNRFFREACDPVLENHGFIDKYIGDGFLAVFGLNKTDPAEFCLDAVRAATRIPGRMRDLNVWLKETFDVTLNFGVGLHFGPAVVGHTGHPLKMQITVLGDTVNIASRIEGRTRQTEARILASSAFCAQVGSVVIPGRKRRFKLTKAGHWDTVSEITGEGIRDPGLLVQFSYDLIRSDSRAFTTEFYRQLFMRSPHLKSLFENTDMDVLQKMFMEMIGRAVQHIHRLQDIERLLRDLGARHQTYGVKPEFYQLAGEALFATLAERLKDQFFPEMREAWVSAYGRITALMQEGAETATHY